MILDFNETGEGLSVRVGRRNYENDSYIEYGLIEEYSEGIFIWKPAYNGPWPGWLLKEIGFKIHELELRSIHPSLAQVEF